MKKICSIVCIFALLSGLLLFSAYAVTAPAWGGEDGYTLSWAATEGADSYDLEVSRRDDNNQLVSIKKYSDLTALSQDVSEDVAARVTYFATLTAKSAGETLGTATSANIAVWKPSPVKGVLPIAGVTFTNFYRSATNNAPLLLNDGVYGKTDNYYCGSNGSASSFVVDLGAVSDITGIKLYFTYNSGSVQYTVQVSEDNADWQSVGTMSTVQNVGTDYKQSELSNLTQKGRYLKFTTTAATKVQLTEIEIYNVSAALEAPTWSAAGTLSWEEVPNTEEYTVRLYKDGELYKTYTTSALTLDVSADMAEMASYKATVSTAADGKESPASARKFAVKDNIAAGKAVTASTTLWYGDNTPISKLVDEDLLTFLQARTNVTEELIIDLGGCYKITEIELYNFHGKDIPYTASVASEADGAYTVVGNLSKTGEIYPEGASEIQDGSAYTDVLVISGSITPTYGRYVKITKDAACTVNSRILEIVVKGTPRAVVSELRLSGEGTQLTVSGSLTKESGAAGNISALLIVAQYDADKKLVGTRCFPVTSESIEETVAILSDTVSAQAFVFDDLQTVIPLGAKANWPSGY